MKRKIFYFLESTLYFYSYTYSPITNREKGNIFLAKIQEFSFAFSKKKKKILICCEQQFQTINLFNDFRIIILYSVILFQNDWKKEE